VSAAKKTSGKKERILRVTLARSPIGYSCKQKWTVQALGLRRMHQTVEQRDTPVIRGMIEKVKHLVTVEEVE
jgi:large subunit ribosomal protein L30